MSVHIYTTTPLGELVATAFDKAAGESSDPREISRRATRSVTLMLRRAKVATTRPRRPIVQVHPQDLLGWT